MCGFRTTHKIPQASLAQHNHSTFSSGRLVIYVTHPHVFIGISVGIRLKQMKYTFSNLIERVPRSNLLVSLALVDLISSKLNSCLNLFPTRNVMVINTCTIHTQTVDGDLKRWNRCDVGYHWYNMACWDSAPWRCVCHTTSSIQLQLKCVHALSTRIDCRTSDLPP